MRPALGTLTRSRTLRRLVRNRAAVVALCFVLFLGAVAIFGSFLMPHDPAAQDLVAASTGPSRHHWLGTDALGRDSFSRLIQGTRTTLWAAVQAVTLAVTAGIPIGLAAGFLGKRVDAVLGRTADVLMAMPPLILALAIAGILGPGLTNAMIAIGIVMAPRMFRIARAAALSVRNETYIEAERAMGCSLPRILFRHVLPNASGALLVQITFGFGAVVTTEATLSFIGLGPRLPTASWGNMVRDSFANIYSSTFPMIAPSLMIVLTILAFSALGDGLRDAVGRQRRVGD